MPDRKMSCTTMIVSFVLLVLCASATFVSADEAAIECPVNSTPTVCVRFCPPQSCDYKPNGRPCIPGACRRGCNCIDGYLKTADGNCVPKNECPKN